MKAFLGAILMALLVGCGGNGSNEPVPPTEAQTKAAAELKPSRDQFAFRLKDEVLKKHGKENVCFSPLSIQLCLSMLLNGTSGDSSASLRTALSLDKQPVSAVNDASYTLISTLTGDSFSMANSIWLQADIEPKPEFVSAIRSNYQGEFFAVKQLGADTVKEINAWTKEKTKERIPELFKNLNDHVVMVLVNALTFDGKWANRFDEAKTAPADFTMPDGKAVAVPTMHQTAPVGYAEANGAQSLKLDYVGGKFSMVFILPPADKTATAYLAKLKPEDLTKTLSALHEREVFVALPKFELRSEYVLNDEMKALGMKDLFERINLSNVSDALVGDLKISEIVHKTYLKVYEEGTEAAAATGIVVERGATPQPVVFKADRPFVYALVQKDTGAIVFLGVVNDPRG